MTFSNVEYIIYCVRAKQLRRNIFLSIQCIKAIVKRESAAYPRAEETLSGYIELLAKMATGGTFSHENHYFKIFKVEKPE